MEGLELVVNEGDLDQVGKQDLFIMNELFEVANQTAYARVHRGNKYCVLEGRTAYPVLARA